MSNDIINFYEVKDKRDKKKTKSDIFKHENPAYENNRMKHPFYCLVSGKGGSGKTNAILNLLSKSPDTYNEVVVFCKMADEPLYMLLQELLKDKVRICTSLDKLNIPEFEKSITGQTLCIFDDVVKESKLNLKKVEMLFMYARKIAKFGCSLIFLSQSFFDVPKFIRVNLMYLILIGKSTSSRDIDLILKEYCLGDINKDELHSIYNDAVKDKLNFFKIDCNAGDVNEKYSKNFNQFYKIE